MQATEKIAIGNDEETEFYDLLWDEMDRHYAALPVTADQNADTEPHNNPVVD